MKRRLAVGFLLAIAGGLAASLSFSSPPENLARELADTPAGMVFVPAGTCQVGSDDRDADAEVKPARRVFVASFYIDRCEVTNAEVQAVKPDFKFVAGRERYPATGLTRDQVEEVLARTGKRLPTPEEWEKAARGTDGRRYPWGDRPEPGRANLGSYTAGARHLCGRSGLKPVGSFPTGASPCGCLDMIGNAWEFVGGLHPGPPPRHYLRGGAFGYPDRYNRTYAFALEEVGVT